ncbi:MAG: peptide/nickel transport system substrate-binding protein [Chloroflexota bacterium]|jgi:peptide/nickel transport system substrate-binding protein|nr:peptide/nickel transport system substrate-binding protein [Chloroflexota bacterium]
MALGACAPQTGPAQSGTGGSAGNTRAANAPGTKILRMGIQREAESFLRPGTTGQSIVFNIADDELTAPDDQGRILAHLAAKIPSTEDGSIRFSSDGAMEVVWTLRPNLTWQDGVPLTADDFLLSWDYLQQPEGLIKKIRWAIYADSVSAADDHTLLVHFPQPYAFATRSWGTGTALLRAMPRHLLSDLYAKGDWDAFNNSPYWTDQFIGLGPYKLDRWLRGTRMEFVRFDNYALGRPPLDRLTLSFFPDLNALIANILTGDVDVCLDCKFSGAQDLDLQKRFEGTGNQVQIGTDGMQAFAEAQFHPGIEVHPAALKDPAVRRALYRAIDRQAIVDAISLGLSPAADSWILPWDQRRQNPAFNAAIIQYPYDPAQAERDLADLGWRRGADGMLQNGAGERFEYDLLTYPDAFADNLLSVMTEQQKRIGVAVNPKINTPQQMNDREYLSTFHGLGIAQNTSETMLQSRFSTLQVTRPENRYSANNRGGYTNPRLDALYERVAATIDEQQQNAIIAEIVRIGNTELPVLPLFWGTSVNVMSAKVRGFTTPTGLGGGTRVPTDWDVAS